MGRPRKRRIRRIESARNQNQIKMADSQVLHAPMMWAQRRDRVFLTVTLADVKDEKIELTETTLHFEGKGGTDQEDYVGDVTFFKEIDTEETTYVVRDREVQFNLVKKDQDTDYWDRLTKEGGKKHWLSIDWGKFIDSDDEGAEDEDFMDFGGMGGPGMGGMGGPGGMDMAKMMEMMGGAGGMGGDMGGGFGDIPGLGGESDSDDSDIPALEEEVA